MKKIMVALAGTITLILVAAGCALFSSWASDVERISTRQLLGMLERSDVIVIDVRTGSDWDTSKSKIKGAVREDPSAISVWMNKYPKDKTLVFYCA